MKDSHYLLFWKTSGMNAVKSMQRDSHLQNTETNTVSNINKEEDDGLHIFRVLQDLVDGMLMESRDLMSYVLLLQKIMKIMVVVLILIITTQ